MELTVEYVPPDPTVIAPEGAVVRLAAKTALANAVREKKNCMMVELYEENVRSWIESLAKGRNGQRGLLAYKDKKME